MMIILTLWATLICGGLFWQVGLLAAMMAHMLYHLVWLPFDLYFYERTAFPSRGNNPRQGPTELTT